MCYFLPLIIGPPYYLKSPSIEYEINSLPHSFYENQYQSNQRFKGKEKNTKHWIFFFLNLSEWESFSKYGSKTTFKSYQ